MHAEWPRNSARDSVTHLWFRMFVVAVGRHPFWEGRAFLCFYYFVLRRWPMALDAVLRCSPCPLPCLALVWGLSLFLSEGLTLGPRIMDFIECEFLKGNAGRSHVSWGALMSTSSGPSSSAWFSLAVSVKKGSSGNTSVFETMPNDLHKKNTHGDWNEPHGHRGDGWEKHLKSSQRLPFDMRSDLHAEILAV